MALARSNRQGSVSYLAHYPKFDLVGRRRPLRDSSPGKSAGSASAGLHFSHGWTDQREVCIRAEVWTKFCWVCTY